MKKILNPQVLEDFGNMAENVGPISRNESLKNVSRDHHFGLLFCWKLRTGLKYAETVRIKKYADHFYKEHLQPHFKLEEKYIFPLLGEESSLVQSAVEDHKQLTRLFEEKESSAESLSRIEKLLEQHIRFEERILFKELQRMIREDELFKALAEHANKSPEDNWEDKFWEHPEK